MICKGDCLLICNEEIITTDCEALIRDYAGGRQKGVIIEIEGIKE